MNLDVKFQACVAVQILAETGQEISDSLVNRGCHKILFNILQTNEDTGTVLYNMASKNKKQIWKLLEYN